ncbi:MAG: type IIL restriction-modification enzyme MmeI [Polyangiaceae bacterium]
MTRVGAYFDAFGGNLPFMGGRRISAAHGHRYATWLARNFDAAGDTDYVAFFFDRAGALLGEHGTIGFIATNTIAQGETRRASLERLVARGMVIYDATTDRPWEGADVLVSIVHLAAGRLTAIATPRRLNGALVPEINSRLRPSKELGDPHALQANVGKAFVGCFLRGDGFLMSDAEAAEHLRRFPNEGDVIKRYMVGDDLNSSAMQQPTRRVITFWDADLAEANRYPGALAVLDERVRPVRERLKTTGADAPHRKYWWRFANTRRDLRATCAARPHCLVTARVSKHLMISRVPTSFVFSEQVVVFGSESYAWFSVLQSRVHEAWVRRFATRFGEGLRYSASECFESFPFPPDTALAAGSAVDVAGQRVHEARAKYMLEENVGLTVTYNRLKDGERVDPSITALRRLHEDVDRAVLDAYGWNNVEPSAYDGSGAAVEAFEDAVLQRLFALNAVRAAAEQIHARALTGHVVRSPRARRRARASRQ